MATKTNERPGTRAVLRHCNMSSYKVREVLDLVRGMDLQRAVEVLEHTERAAAPVVLKLVRSAAANAEHNEGLDSTELYLATAFADEGATLKRWRPRARGRATRIRKRSCHITVILARMPDEQIARRRARVAANAAELRARRVAGARRGRTRPSETIDEQAALAAFEGGAGVDDMLTSIDAETDVVETDVVETDVIETESVEAEPVEAEPTETESPEVDAVETDEVAVTSESDGTDAEEEGN